LSGAWKLWRRDCSTLGGATRYQVVNSTDGVSGYQGEEGNHNHQALQTSHDCSAFYFEIFRPLRLETADWLQAAPIKNITKPLTIISGFYLPQTMA